MTCTELREEGLSNPGWAGENKQAGGLAPCCVELAQNFNVEKPIHKLMYGVLLPAHQSKKLLPKNAETPGEIT
jgi:hypothetical protein